MDREKLEMANSKEKEINNLNKNINYAKSQLEELMNNFGDLFIDNIRLDGDFAGNSNSSRYRLIDNDEVKNNKKVLSDQVFEILFARPNKKLEALEREFIEI